MLERLEHRFPLGLELEKALAEGGAGGRIDADFLRTPKETAQALHSLPLEEVLDERPDQVEPDSIRGALPSVVEIV